MLILGGNGCFRWLTVWLSVLSTKDNLVRGTANHRGTQQRTPGPPCSTIPMEVNMVFLKPSHTIPAFFLKYFLGIGMLLCCWLFLGCSDDKPNASNTTTASGKPPEASKDQGEYGVQDPSAYFDVLDPFQSVMGKVVFVTKDVYGGDLKYNCILRGKVRNVTGKPLKEVYIIWWFWDENDYLIEINPTNMYNPPPSFWVDKIDYLDSKAEANFEINLSLYEGMTPIDGRLIREAVLAGRHEACIFVLRESG